MSLADTAGMQLWNSFTGGQKQAQDAQMGQLQQMGVLQQIAQRQQAMQQEQMMRQLLSESGGDIEKAIQGAVKSGNIAAIHALAPAYKIFEEQKARKDNTEAVKAIFGPIPSTATQGVAAAPQVQAQPPAPSSPGAESYPGGGEITPTGSAPVQLPTSTASQIDPKEALRTHLKALAIRFANNPAALVSIEKQIEKIDADSKPMVEHNFPVGDNKVQPHISLDNGRTWKPIPGSQPIAKFSNQVVSVNSGDKSAYTNVQPDGKGGFIGLSKASGKMEQIPQAAGIEVGGKLSSDALENAATGFLTDGKMPPNLGRGQQRSVNIINILNRSSELAKERGDSAQETKIRQMAGVAAQSALTDLTKRESQVGAFERTFVKNTELVENLSDKVDRTGVPILNKWINAGKKSIAGDPDIAALDAAVKGAVNEYTKIVSGSMGNVAMAEGEIKKIEGLLSSAQTPEQVKNVIKTMKIETQNRMAGFKEQKAEIMSSIISKNPSNTKIREFATEADAIASGVKGKVRIGGRNATID